MNINFDNYNNNLKFRNKVPIRYIKGYGIDLIREYISQKVNSKKTLSILDFGCGDNEKWNKLCIQKGFDIDKNSNADYFDLKEINENFDLIIMANVINFMDDKKFEKSINWSYNHCHELIILTMIDNGFSQSFQDRCHYKLRYSSDYFTYLKEKGFSDIEWIYCSPTSLYNPLKILFQKIICWLFNTHNYNQLLIIARNLKK